MMKSTLSELKNVTPVQLFLLIALPVVLITVIMIIISKGELFLASLCDDPNDVFMDYFNSIMYSVDFPYIKWKVSYPPLITLAYSIIGHISQPLIDEITNGTNLAFMLRNSQVGMIIFLSITIVICYSLLLLSQKILSKETFGVKTITPVLLLLSYPLLFALERGNCIYATIVLCLTFVLYYDNEKQWIKYASYFALGCAISMKLTPILLALLVLREKKLHDVIILAIICINIFFIPSLFLDFNIIDYLTSMISLSSLHSTGYIINTNSWLQLFGLEMVINGRNYLPLTINIILFIILLAMTLSHNEIKKWELSTAIICYLVIGFGLGLPYMMGYLVISTLLFFDEEKNVTKYNIAITVILFFILAILPCPYDLRFVLVSLRSILIYLLFAAILMRLYVFKSKDNNMQENDGFTELENKQSNI